MKNIFVIFLLLCFSVIVNNASAQSAAVASLRAKAKQQMELKKQEGDKTNQKAEEQKRQLQAEKINQPAIHPAQQSGQSVPASDQSTLVDKQRPKEITSTSQSAAGQPLLKKKNKKEDINQ